LDIFKDAVGRRINEKLQFDDNIMFESWCAMTRENESGDAEKNSNKFLSKVVEFDGYNTSVHTSAPEHGVYLVTVRCQDYEVRAIFTTQLSVLEILYPR
jgi:hypothetical protein